MPKIYAFGFYKMILASLGGFILKITLINSVLLCYQIL